MGYCGVEWRKIQAHLFVVNTNGSVLVTSYVDSDRAAALRPPMENPLRKDFDSPHFDCPSIWLNQGAQNIVDDYCSGGSQTYAKDPAWS